MFFKELYDLRNQILQEREEHKNKYDVEQFMTYLRDVICNDKENIQESFRCYVRNNPSRNTFNIERIYSIPNSHANGLHIFCGFFGNEYMNTFIKDIINKEYNQFSITIKNITEKDNYKLYINYFIDLNKIRLLLSET